MLWRSQNPAQLPHHAKRERHSRGRDKSLARYWEKSQRRGIADPTKDGVVGPGRAPRHTFGDLFFHFEHASLAIFSPEPVTTFLVRPDHHVFPIGDSLHLSTDEWHRVPGYQGLYNFCHPFWVARGSRLYPCFSLDPISGVENWNEIEPLQLAPWDRDVLIDTLLPIKKLNAGAANRGAQTEEMIRLKTLTLNGVPVFPRFWTTSWTGDVPKKSKS